MLQNILYKIFYYIFPLTLADIMEYFVLFLKRIGIRASIQITIFSQPVTFHSIELDGGSFPHS